MSIYRQLQFLPPMTRFYQHDLGIVGTLVSANDCRANVRLDRPARSVTIHDDEGQVRSFLARPQTDTSWAPTVLVEVLRPETDPEPERAKTMTTTTKKIKTTADKNARVLKQGRAKAKAEAAAAKPGPKAATVKAAAKATPEAKGKAAPKAAKDAGDGQPSPRAIEAAKKLDGAFKVLDAATEPLGAHEIVRRMHDKKLTEVLIAGASIYQPLAKDIEANGAKSRFVKCGVKFGIAGKDYPKPEKADAAK